MKYVGVCRIKQGKRTGYELSQAEIEDIKQYIPQALREGAASGVCEGSGAVSAVLVLQTIAANLGSMLTPYTAVSLGMLGSCLAVAGREEKDAGKGLLSHKHRLVALWHQLAGSFTIVAFFALGCALGVSHRIPSLPAEAGFYALCLLLICVGLTVGQSNEIRRSLRRIDKRLMWLPVLTIVGTWAGAVATACLLQGRSFTDWLAISSGFGYYSLSSILITEARNAEMGTVALIYNILRELMALLCAPLFRQFFGPLAPISVGGATTGDTTLPIISRTSGQTFIPLSIYHGLTIDFTVPFLVPFFCSL